MATITERVKAAVDSIDDSGSVAAKFVDPAQLTDVVGKSGNLKPLAAFEKEADATVVRLGNDISALKDAAELEIGRIAHFEQETFVAGVIYAGPKIYFVEAGLAYTPISYPFTASLLIQTDIDSGSLTIYKSLTKLDFGRSGATVLKSEDGLLTLASLEEAIAENLNINQHVKVRLEGLEFLVVPYNTGPTGFGYFHDMLNGNQLKLIISSQVENIPALRLREPKFEGEIIRLEGHTQSGIGGDSFIGTYTSPEIDDNGFSIKTALGCGWKRLRFGYVTPQMFGWLPGLANATELMAGVTAAMQRLGIRDLKLPHGVFTAKITAFNGIQIFGKGWSNYSNTMTISGTAWYRPRTESAALDLAGADVFNLQDVDISGNGGADDFYGDCIADSVGFAGDGSLMRVKTIDGNVGIHGDGADSLRNMTLLHVIIRNNNYGLRGLRDSSMLGVTISANRIRGWVCNEGQLRFSHGFIEWQRGVNNEASHGIELRGNANEVIIEGTQFDRNSGHDIIMVSTDGGSPTDISISGCQMKGAAWGTDLPVSKRLSIYAAAGSIPKTISLNNITVQTRSYSPSTIKGPLSPLGFCNLANAVGVVSKGNNLASLSNPIIVGSFFSWVLSANGTGEYYIAVGNEDPYLDPPDDVTKGIDVFSVGTIGGLTDNQYCWGDNDSLGYETVYLKMAGGMPAEDEIKIHYDVAPMVLGASDIETDEFRDVKTLGVGANSSVTFILKTRGRMNSTYSRKGLVMCVAGDETGTLKDAFAKFPFLLSRSGSGIGVSVKEGIVSVEEDGYTQGWATAAADTLQVLLVGQPSGDEVEVTLTNAGVNRLDLRAWLEW